MTRFQFVADHRDAFEVKRMCEVIEVNRSSFYAWDAAAGARAARSATDEQLAERIRVVHEADQAYGAPRVTAVLNDGAPPEERVNHKRVARVMAERGIEGIKLRRRVRTTIPEPSDETLAGAAAFSDEKSCRRQIFRWAVRYNTRRRHSYLGHQAPNTYENTLTATLPEAA